MLLLVDIRNHNVLEVVSREQFMLALPGAYSDHGVRTGNCAGGEEFGDDSLG
jgi:hypothetical protein